MEVRGPRCARVAGVMFLPADVGVRGHHKFSVYRDLLVAFIGASSRHRVWDGRCSFTSKNARSRTFVPGERWKHVKLEAGEAFVASRLWFAKFWHFASASEETIRMIVRNGSD